MTKAGVTLRIALVALAMAGFALIAGSRIQFGEAVWLGILVLALVVVERAIFYDVLRRLRSRGVALEPVIVVGAGPTAERLTAAMDEHPEYGLRPIGFVDSSDTSPLPEPYLGEVTDLPDIMVDADMIYQALLNLFINGMQAWLNSSGPSTLVSRVF